MLVPKTNQTFSFFECLFLYPLKFFFFFETRLRQNAYHFHYSSTSFICIKNWLNLKKNKIALKHISFAALQHANYEMYDLNLKSMLKKC